MAPTLALRGAFVVLGLSAEHGLQNWGTGISLGIHPIDNPSSAQSLEFVQDLKLPPVDLPGAHAGLEISHQEKFLTAVNGREAEPVDGLRHAATNFRPGVTKGTRRVLPESYTKMRASLLHTTFELSGSHHEFRLSRKTRRT